MSATVIPLNREKNTKSEVQIADSTLESLFRFRGELQNFVSGKEKLVDGIICALLSGGHVLLEDVPGVGKTTLIRTISRLLGLEMKRIQCTSDLLPSDILGVEVFNSITHEFTFHQGPIFANIILADELNRSSPRTQSALLEAMGEGAVTVDRKTYSLPKPFIVFAAQNPSDHLGTYPLPESQLDRFSVKLCLDYPEAAKEKEIFTRAVLDPVKEVSEACIKSEQLLELQNSIEKVFISERIASYVKRFIDATRVHPSLKRGVSTRGGISWLRLARARALMAKREYVIPDDCLELASLCLSHRVIGRTGSNPDDVIKSLIQSIPIE